MRFKTVFTGLLTVVSTLVADAYSIYPVPRNMTLSGATIDLGSTVNIVTSDESAKYVSRLKEVLDDAGLTYTIGSVGLPGVVDVYIGAYGSGDVADIYSATLTGNDTSIFPSTTGRYDPHILRIDDDGDCGAILVLGDADGSAYYGCATLEQMLEQEPHSAMPTVVVTDYAHARYRGIMEGFYGHPYSMESRLNLLEFCKRYKMNYYGYGPKADPYHAGNWRLEYPATVTDAQRNLGQLTSSDMAAIAAKAKECNVDFVWIIHPSLGTYSIDLSWTNDIMTKFEHLYGLGVRHFGVSVDDMRGHPSNQGLLAANVQAAIDAKWNTEGAADDDRVGPVLFTPTVYALNYGSSYVLQSFSSIDSKIDVAFTGYDCFSNVRASSFGTMAEYIGRDPVFWWNNPTNDDYDGFLYLHGLTARWTIEQEGAVNHMKGFLMNPMNQGQASKICLFSGADYAWNPDGFDAQASWLASLRAAVKTDENVQALSDFIKVMSAYTTHDTQTPEGEEYADLYALFQSCITNIDKNGVESLEEVEELYTVMQRTVLACEWLSLMAESSDEDCRLFFTDIEPWLLKVHDMASIIVDAFDALRGTIDYDNWTDAISIADRAASIHENHTFSVLEGSGTSTYETFKEAQPTPKHLDALIDFIAKHNFAVRLPQRDRTPEVVSNFPEEYNRGTVVVDENAGELTLSGYGQVFDWTPGLYLGINFNRLQSICANDIERSDAFSGLQLQYSVNGKTWIDVPVDPAEKFEAAYVRVVNSGTSSVNVPVGGTINAPLASMESVGNSGDFNITVSTNMNNYMSYVVNNVIDGDASTFFWSNGTPTAGVSYISLDLGTTARVSGVNMQFNNSDQPSGSVSIQTSLDGSTWSDAAAFTKSDIINNEYSATFSAVTARYVRMLISTISTTEWLQVAEFGVTASPIGSTSISSSEVQAVAEDHNSSGVYALDDRSLSTFYKAGGAGYLIYNFTENLKIDEILVFHNSSFTSISPLPTMSLYADGAWIDCGFLDGECTHIATATLQNIEQLKIEWNAENVPNLYEIMPIGDPYDENQSSAGIDTIVDDTEGIRIDTSHGTISVVSAQPVSSVRVYDIAGCQLVAYSGDSSCNVTVDVPLSSPAVVIVSVSTATGRTCTRRVMLNP